jgi:membrane dipeptidase
MVVVEAHRDCYEQIHWQNMGEENPVRDRLAQRLRAGGVDIVIYAIGGDTLAHSNGRDKKLLATVDNMQALGLALDSCQPPASLILKSGDIPTTPDDRLRFLLHLEGGSPLEGSLSALDALFAMGLRSMQPTWNVRNELGDGVHERDTGGGLTRFGVTVVRRMQELGMLIDLSHMAEAGFWHVLRAVDGPVSVTHANSRTVHDHPRNLTDEQVRAIADRDGVIGVHTLPTFVGPGKPTIEDLVDHVVHFVETVGVAHVGFGGDFVACDGPRPAREALFHDPREAPPTLAGLAEAQELPNFTEALLRRGFADDEVGAILGGNFRRTLQEVLPS